MNSFTITDARSFTVTHARELASKVAADLRRVQRFYSAPSIAEIDDYEAELVVMLKGSYLQRVTYGFRRDRTFISPTLEYSAVELASGSVNDDPGSISPHDDVSNAAFTSYLEYSAAWSALTDSARELVRQESPVKRVGADKPGLEGYFSRDRSYVAGGRGLDRSTLRRF